MRRGVDGGAEGGRDAGVAIGQRAGEIVERDAEPIVWPFKSSVPEERALMLVPLRASELPN